MIVLVCPVNISFANAHISLSLKLNNLCEAITLSSGELDIAKVASASTTTLILSLDTTFESSLKSISIFIGFKLSFLHP